MYKNIACKYIYKHSKYIHKFACVLFVKKQKKNKKKKKRTTRRRKRTKLKQRRAE